MHRDHRSLGIVPSARRVGASYLAHVSKGLKSGRLPLLLAPGTRPHRDAVTPAVESSDRQCASLENDGAIASLQLGCEPV